MRRLLQRNFEFLLFERINFFLPFFLKNGFLQAHILKSEMAFVFLKAITFNTRKYDFSSKFSNIFFKYPFFLLITYLGKDPNVRER